MKEIKNNFQFLIRDYLYEDITDKRYASFRYPSFLPNIKIESNQYKILGYGIVSTIFYSSKSYNQYSIFFIPSLGQDVPLLLINIKEIKGKYLGFVEYYDCTDKELSFNELNNLKDKYHYLEDFEEKDEWYIKERMNVSLIKQGKKEDIIRMIFQSIHTYFDLSFKAKKDLNNINGLKFLKGRIIKEDIPSLIDIEKIIGREEYIKYLNEYILFI